MRVLAGDVGGTKTSLALYEVEEGHQLEQLALDSVPSQKFGSLDEIVRQFLAKHDVEVEWASFGIAGPVRNGQARTTNLPWLVDASRLEDEVGFRRVWLLNDLEANAWGIGALNEADFLVLSEGDPDPEGNAAIISAGTGLGQAGLYWDGERHRPFASEGGHSDFAPNSDLEIDLLQYLKKHYEHVSWERVVSGMGLVNIYEFLVEHRHKPTPDWLSGEMHNSDAAAAISKAARADRCPVCSEALDMFVHLYGVEAGNHALKIMATGGVYIGGGIAPRNLDRFREYTLMRGFWSKGRMESLMRTMPVKVILNDRTALFGPAVFAASESGRP